jgi:hypothetical protein
VTRLSKLKGCPRCGGKIEKQSGFLTCYNCGHKIGEQNLIAGPISDKIKYSGEFGERPKYDLTYPGKRRVPLKFE